MSVESRRGGFVCGEVHIQEIGSHVHFGWYLGCGGEESVPSIVEKPGSVKGGGAFVKDWWVKPQVHGSTEVVKRVSFRQGVMNSINFQRWLEKSFEL